MSKDGELHWLLQCSGCDGTGEIYHDSDIGTVYCSRCNATGYGVLIRFPLFLLRGLLWLIKWAIILTAVWYAIAFVLRYLFR